MLRWQFVTVAELLLHTPPGGKQQHDETKFRLTD